MITWVEIIKFFRAAGQEVDAQFEGHSVLTVILSMCAYLPSRDLNSATKKIFQVSWYKTCLFTNQAAGWCYVAFLFSLVIVQIKVLITVKRAADNEGEKKA